MKKLLLFLFLMIVSTSVARADIDYMKIYNDLENPTFQYIHGIDPDQYFDMKNYSWSPYPLFRLNQEVYFKKQKIEPGYYLLTPREHEGQWYILFKENGVVKATIPCYENEIVAPDFYATHLEKEKLTPSGKIYLDFTRGLSNWRKNGQKKSSPKTFLEVDDLDNDFLSMTIYYGSRKYSILLRSKMMQ